MGFGLWPSALIDAARKLSVNCHSCVAASYQHAAITALDEAWDQVEHMVATFDRRRKFAADLLNDLPGVTCRVPKGAFYAFPNITQTGRESRELAKDLLENHSLALLSGTDFGAQGEGFLRVSVAASDEDIQKGVDRIRTCLAQH